MARSSYLISRKISQQLRPASSFCSSEVSRCKPGTYDSQARQRSQGMTPRQLPHCRRGWCSVRNPRPLPPAIPRRGQCFSRNSGGDRRRAPRRPRAHGRRLASAPGRDSEFYGHFPAWPFCPPRSGFGPNQRYLRRVENMRVALSNPFGFGGINACLVFAKA